MKASHCVCASYITQIDSHMLLDTSDPVPPMRQRLQVPGSEQLRSGKASSQLLYLLFQLTSYCYCVVCHAGLQIYVELLGSRFACSVWQSSCQCSSSSLFPLGDAGSQGTRNRPMPAGVMLTNPHQHACLKTRAQAIPLWTVSFVSVVGILRVASGGRAGMQGWCRAVAPCPRLNLRSITRAQVVEPLPMCFLSTMISVLGHRCVTASRSSVPLGQSEARPLGGPKAELRLWCRGPLTRSCTGARMTLFFGSAKGWEGLCR